MPAAGPDFGRSPCAGGHEMMRAMQILAWSAYAYVAWAGTNEWTNVGPEGGPNILPMAVDPNDSANVWAGTSVGVFRSRDRGTSWSNAGLTGLCVSRLILGPQRPGRLTRLRSALRIRTAWRRNCSR